MQRNVFLRKGKNKIGFLVKKQKVAFFYIPQKSISPPPFSIFQFFIYLYKKNQSIMFAHITKNIYIAAIFIRVS